MVDRIRNTSVLRYALVGEVDLAVGVNCYVLQQSVALDGSVDIGFAFLVEVDNLGIATTFVVEYAFVVPSVLVVADQLTLRVSRQGSLTCTGQTEEDGSVSAFHVGVGRAVHGSDAAQRVQVVHDREDTLLHFTAVPSVQDNLFVGLQVEYSSCLRVQTQFLVVVNLSLGSVERYEIGFAVVGQFFFCRTDEHVLYEVCLPCYFHDETYFQTSSGVGAAECIHNEQTLAGELLNGFGLQVGPSCFGAGLVVVLVSVRSPPYSVLAGFVINEEFIFRRTAGVDTSHYVYCAQFCYLAFFVAFQTSFGLFFKQYFIRRVVENLLYVLNTVLA